MISLSARGIRATWEPGCGHLPDLVIGGVPVLWAAPWRDDPAIQADQGIPKVDRRLGGTFTCLPFGRDDLDHGPPHGAPANGPWRLRARAPGALTATCSTPRGRVSAQIALRDGHPVLYQTHVLDLTAPATFAHHPMIQGVHAITHSPARAVHTFPSMEPPGVERWPPDTRSAALPLLPDGPGTDFATIVSEPGLGWTAATRASDTILFLRPSKILPVTNIWLWNGGRVGPPWRGQALDICGVEDAICAGAAGFAAALDDNRIAAEGVPTALASGRHVIPHAIARLPDATIVESVDITPDSLTAGGVTIPFDGSHLA
ncbi:MAG: hypothetical protein AAGF30_15530 [Pseudomonadota bacterium]